MKKKKILGILCLLSLPIVLVVFAVSRIVYSSLQPPRQYLPSTRPAITSSLNEPFEITYGTAELQKSTPMHIMAALSNVILSLLGILSLIVGLPLGVYLLAKASDEEQAEKTKHQPIQPPSQSS